VLFCVPQTEEKPGIQCGKRTGSLQHCTAGQSQGAQKSRYTRGQPVYFQHEKYKQTKQLTSTRACRNRKSLTLQNENKTHNTVEPQHLAPCNSQERFLSPAKRGRSRDDLTRESVRRVGREKGLKHKERAERTRATARRLDPEEKISTLKLIAHARTAEPPRELLPYHEDTTAAMCVCMYNC